MAHRKEEFDANGHSVTIQQVNEGGSVSAWIDGYAAHTGPAVEVSPITAEGLSDWERVARMCAFMADNNVYFCRKCGSFYDSSDVSGTGFAGHICGDCARENAHCPDNPDDDSHEDECLNPHQRNNARISTKYRCVHCGRTRKTMPTG